MPVLPFAKRSTPASEVHRLESSADVSDVPARPTTVPTPSAPLRQTDARPSIGPGTLPLSHADLRAAIGQIERSGQGHRTVGQSVSTGFAAVDSALPWGGLPRGCFHDITGPATSAAALGFAAHLCSHLSTDTRPIVWCGRVDDLYAPGLAAFGLRPDRLLMVSTRDADTLPWILEEAARSGAPAAAVALLPPATRDRVRPLGGTGHDVAVRRLQLACERSGVTILTVQTTEPGAILPSRGPAATRWRVSPTAQHGQRHTEPLRPAAQPLWVLDLMRCRGGRPASWTIAATSNRTSRHDDPGYRGASAYRLAVVSDLCDRSHSPSAPPHSQSPIHAIR